MERFSMEKAQHIISPEQEAESVLREKNKFQLGMIFDGEPMLKDNSLERRPCTPEEKEDLDATIEQLGDVFADADFFWQLDGALNISLYRGQYIGIHKDVDVSINAQEIEKVESYLLKKGFGFFLSSWNDATKQRTFERVSGENFVKNKVEHQPMIIAIDENGKIRHDSKFSHVDTHIVKWDENGNPTGTKDKDFPSEWLAPKVIDFHGRKIHCSHPARAAYFKFFHTRGYDTNDLRLLAESGVLTTSDIDLIDETFERHISKDVGIVHSFVNRVFPQIEFEDDATNIVNVLINDELVRDRFQPEMNNETMRLINGFAENIAKMPTRSNKIIFDYIFATTVTNRQQKLKNERIAILRSSIPQQEVIKDSKM